MEEQLRQLERKIGECLEHLEKLHDETPKKRETEEELRELKETLIYKTLTKDDYTSAQYKLAEQLERMEKQTQSVTDRLEQMESRLTSAIASVSKNS